MKRMKRAEKAWTDGTKKIWIVKVFLLDYNPENEDSDDDDVHEEPTEFKEKEFEEWYFKYILF